MQRSIQGQTERKRTTKSPDGPTTRPFRPRGVRRGVAPKRCAITRIVHSHWTLATRCLVTTAGSSLIFTSGETSLSCGIILLRTPRHLGRAVPSERSGPCIYASAWRSLHRGRGPNREDIGDRGDERRSTVRCHCNQCADRNEEVRCVRVLSCMSSFITGLCPCLLSSSGYLSQW